MTTSTLTGAIAVGAALSSVASWVLILATNPSYRDASLLGIGMACAGAPLGAGVGLIYGKVRS